MIVAVDTGVLVHWLMAGAPSHVEVSRWVEDLAAREGRLGLTEAVLSEFLHVATDARRFERPLAVPAALRLARQLWYSPDVAQLFPSPASVDRAMELMQKFRLGRKRILDTMLAATLEINGVVRLATFNVKDFALFSFLEASDPARSSSSTD